MRLKAVVGFGSGAKKRISKDGRNAGPRISGTDNLGSIASQDTQDDENEIPVPKRKKVPSVPKFCVMLWEPGGTCDGPFNQRI